MNLPADVINQALDAAAIDEQIGDPQEGTRVARVANRAYSQCLRQLLRAANWDFARRQVHLNLLADASGQTPNVGTTVIPPWIYEYEYPTDCMKVRFVPFNDFPESPIPAGNIELPPTVPQTTGVSQPPYVGQRVRPARFLIANDTNYPPQPGSNFWELQGVSPTGRLVILTNVKNAQIVYTYLAIYPNLWDALFRAAFVAYLASEIALPLAKDKRFGLTIRQQQIAIAKAKISEARVADGNEGNYSTDIPVDWMNVRISGGPGFGGGPWWGAGWGPGVWGGVDSCLFADGTAY